jgi:hypothetical protein
MGTPLRRRQGRRAAAVLAALLTACSGGGILPSGSAPLDGGMSFFVTSRAPGRGGDLGGLAGADAHCQALATAAGAGHRTWRAYLSTQAAGGAPAVNARDRIGRGPWLNADGVIVAGSLDELHGANQLNKRTALDERGRPVPGRGDKINRQDMLTGSRPDGTAFPPGVDRTCGNWTRNGEGMAMVGHHDRKGVDETMASWNSAHRTPDCSQKVLNAIGGAGLFYCFAVR